MRALVGDSSPRVLVGFSGGADSLALVGALASIRRTAPFELSALHVDHGVRAGSSVEAEQVRASGEHLGIDVVVYQIDSARLAAHAGVGREEALRRERYLAFAKAMRAGGFDVVALAHHQRDQAETVLLHLLCGSGLRGASGMREASSIRVPWWESEVEPLEVKVWRPFLAEPVDEVRGYSNSIGVPIIEDESNADSSYRRNAIRHEVLPVLEGVVPGATINLARFAGLAGADDDLLDSLAGDVLTGLADGSCLTREVLLGAPMGLRRRVVQAWLRERPPVGLEVSLNRIEEVVRAVEAKGPERVIQIGEGVSVRVARDGATVERPDREA
jgi:tRNA(Ile)-lysidine synthase